MQPRGPGGRGVNDPPRPFVVPHPRLTPRERAALAQLARRNRGVPPVPADPADVASWRALIRAAVAGTAASDPGPPGGAEG